MELSLPLLICILRLIFKAECRLQTKQYVDVWFSETSDGKPNYTWTEDTNTTLPKNTSGTVIYKVNGLWEMTICRDENCKLYSRLPIGGNGKGVVMTGGGSKNYFKMRAQRFGDLNMNKTELWLYLEGFEGVPTVVKEEGKKGINMEAAAYFWTGEKDWSITFSNGTKQCLKSEVKTNGYWIRYSFQDIHVKDAVVGCL